jgi:hypothetical protein
MTRLRSLAAVLLPALMAFALAACAATATGTHGGATGPADGDRFSLAPGAMVTLPGEGTLRYARLVDDSRCMPDVQCVWAGDAEVAFEWRPTRGGTDAFSLHTGKGDKSHRIGSHLLVLAGLERGVAPEAQLTLEAAP